VGQITLVDHDRVELTNLQRQIMHQNNSVGMSKVGSGKRFLSNLNPEITIHAFEELVMKVSVVIDCTDNFVTRHLINRISLKHGKALVSGAAIGFDAQISVFDFRQASSPCYACVFPPDPHFVETSCASMGVFSPLVGIIGSLQAAQALQILIGFGEPLLGRLLIWNARNSQIDEIKIQRNLDCPVCGAR
jgi:molybdopterin/thiamine biosynthesis adenylyltransferase